MAVRILNIELSYPNLIKERSERGERENEVNKVSE